MDSSEVHECLPPALEKLAIKKAKNRELLLEFCVAEIDNQKYERVVEYFRRIDDESAIDTIIERAYEGRVFKVIKLIGYLRGYETRLKAADKIFDTMSACGDLSSPYILYFNYRLKLIANERDFNVLERKLKAKYQDLKIRLVIALRVVFISWAAMIRAANFQHILNFANENDETGSSLGHFLKDLISEAYAEQKLSDVENILNFVSSLSSPGQQLLGYQTMFEKMNSQHNEREIFMLAHRICTAMADSNLPFDQKAAYEEMKARLPQPVRTIIWNQNVYLKNTLHNEYMYSPAANFNFNSDRLHVFTWGPGKKDSDCRWRFESDNNGRSFYIKCLHWDEYFYASDNSYKFDEKQRRVFTFRSKEKTKLSSFRWFIAVNGIGGKEISIQNECYGEYLYAPSEWYNKNRRHVFTSVEKTKRADGFWFVEEAS